MYYFEYDKNGYLIKYIETEKETVYSEISVSNSSFYCVIKDNLVTKFEENGFFKTVSKYQRPIKLTQSFSEGESWVKVLNKTDSSIINSYNYDTEDVLLHKETNYPWVTTYSAHTSLENYVTECVGNVNEYAIPISVISLEGESLSHLNFKVQNSFLEKWSNIIDF